MHALRAQVAAAREGEAAAAVLAARASQLRADLSAIASDAASGAAARRGVATTTLIFRAPRAGAGGITNFTSYRPIFCDSLYDHEP